MEQEKTKKIIITVGVGTIRPDFFINYQAYGSFECYEVYMLILKKYSNVFDNQDFISYLKGLKYINQLEREMSIFPDNIDYSKVVNNDNFQNWIQKKTNKENFICNLIKTNNLYLIRKHKKAEIYVVPLLNRTFVEENVIYTDMLINAFKKKDDDLWLLLHDKDLYSSDRSCRLVNKNDDGLGQINSDNFCELYNLVEGKRVYVFKHDSNADYYYDKIVLQLDDEKLTSERIVNRLNNPAILLAEELGKKIKKNEIELGIINAPNSISYDFSKQFLEL